MSAMLMKSWMRAGRFVPAVLLVALFTTCSVDHTENEIADTKINFSFSRFEKDLFERASREGPLAGPLRQTYGAFADLFIHRILQIPEGPDSLVDRNLRLFTTDPEVADVYRRVDSLYGNTHTLEANLEDFLRRYHYYYPQKNVPAIVTFISAFNYAVIATDSTIGIGLDMFLGPETPYYPRIGLPKYLFEHFAPDYIYPAVLKGWFQSDYDPEQVKSELLSQIVYQGKMLYYCKTMAPAMHDSLLTGYSGAQLKWCEANEAQIWSFLIENKLLFNTDPSLYQKYVNEGPTTSGFPKESPGKIGAWIGWRIVQAYARNNESVTLPQLMDQSDALSILEGSGYKPK